jgi:hypothetical protein
MTSRVPTALRFILAVVGLAVVVRKLLAEP